MRDALALDRAGVFSMVLEGMPREVAAMITAEVQAPGGLKRYEIVAVHYL